MDISQIDIVETHKEIDIRLSMIEAKCLHNSLQTVRHHVLNNDFREFLDRLGAVLWPDLAGCNIVAACNIDENVDTVDRRTGEDRRS